MAVTDTVPRIDALGEDGVVLPPAAAAAAAFAAAARPARAYDLGLLARGEGRVEDGRVEVLGDLGLGDGFGGGEGGAGVIAGVLELLARREGWVEGGRVEGLEYYRVTLVRVGHTLMDGSVLKKEVAGRRRDGTRSDGRG